MGTSSTLVWLVIVLAVVAANLPFVVQRFFLLGQRMASKPWWLYLLEMLLLYVLVGTLARWVEARLGQVHEQGMAFYVITGSLFLLFAFPGLVYRHLVKRQRGTRAMLEQGFP